MRGNKPSKKHSDRRFVYLSKEGRCVNCNRFTRRYDRLSEEYLCERHRNPEYNQLAYSY